MSKIVHTIGAVTRQFIKIMGLSGNVAEVTDDNKLQVVLEGKVVASNSSTTPLGIGEEFIGTAEETLDVSLIYITVYTDQNSDIEGFHFEQSSDSTNWDHHDHYSVEATPDDPAGKTYSIQPSAKYFRVHYVNGKLAQSVFRLQTIFKRSYGLPSSHRVSDTITDDDDAQLVKAVVTGRTKGGDFANFGATEEGNFKISIEENMSAANKLQITILKNIWNELRKQTTILEETLLDDEME